MGELSTRGLLDIEDEQVRHFRPDPAFLRALAGVLGPGGLITDPEDLAPYECDGLTQYRATPLAVVLPESEAQVRGVLEACAQFAVPIVPRGAGTGISAGATPRQDGIVLSMTRMRRIVDFDAPARQIAVEPGVTNLSVSKQTDPADLYYAPDPSSQMACTIGGNVAENSGGVHCLKYGLTTHNLLGVRLATLEGETLDLGGAALDAAGYDLLSVVTGSEGLLGIVVEARLKLLPKPPTTRVLLAFFPDLASGSRAVSGVLSEGVIPAGLEMMDHEAIVATERYVPLGMPLDAGGGVLCELDGTREEVLEQSAIVERVLRDCGARDLRIADTEEERAKVWIARKGAYPAIVTGAHDTYLLDCTIPRRALPRVLARVAELAREKNLYCANVFHAGDGNIHPILKYDGSIPGEAQRAEAFGAEILELCIAEGGTSTGEHGVGLDKLKGMCKQFSPQELEAFHGVKRAFDPSGLLNPGKAVPTLHRCAELGAMHIKRGKDKFAHLPRF